MSLAFSCFVVLYFHTRLTVQSYAEADMTARTAQQKSVGGGSGTSVLLDRMIDTAFDLFIDRGYDNVRISDITEAVGIAKGTFYLYFPNKRRLLLACFGRVRAIARERDARVHVTKGDLLSTLGPRLLQDFEEEAKWDRLLAWVRRWTASEDSEIAQTATLAANAVVQTLKHDLIEAISEGVAREVDPELAIWAFVGMVEVVSWRAKLDNEYDMGKVAATVNDLMQHALRPSTSVPLDSLAHPRTWAVVTDRTGVPVELEQVIFGGRPRILGSLGRGQVVVDPGRVDMIDIREDEEGCAFVLLMRDGAEATLVVNPDLVVCGESRLGTVSYAAKDLAKISFMKAGSGSEPEWVEEGAGDDGN